MKDSFSLTRRGLLSLMAAGGASSVLIGQGVLPLFGAEGVGSETAGQEKAPDLQRLIESPVTIEIPGESPRTLKPGPARSVFNAKISEFPKLPGLTIRQVVRDLGGGVVERSIEVVADRDITFNLELPYEFPRAESFYSWRRKENARVALMHDRLVPDKLMKPGVSVQLWPFAGAVEGGQLTGVLSDTPGFWENRSQQIIDPAQRRILLRTGDGSPKHITSGTNDSAGYLTMYHAEFDGWQHIRKSQMLEFKTWLFAAPVRDLYDIQLAAHRALATGKGWNDSAVTAILRNAAYLLVRRNLVRPESRYMISSGPNYGWHQWVCDMAMMGLGLQDMEILAEGMRGTYWNRQNGEDQAQWYLIVAALLARAGFKPNSAMCRSSLEYMRDNEKDGAFVPPPAMADPKNLGWKTYMDIFYYTNGDTMTSNQGFHCGGLMAAQELGFPIRDADVRRAETAYAKMFNSEGGYFPTSVMRPEVFGGDALYGEAVSFAAFGKKSLPDDLVQRHCRHAMKIQSPWGIRIFSKANGDFLEADQYGPKGGLSPYGLPPEESGEYCQGGSWFFCDAGTWLSGLIHGLDASLVDSLLVRRIQAELTHEPAFGEAISTRTGLHSKNRWGGGNIMYAPCALYLWLRPTIRQRLGHKGPDPVNATVDNFIRNRPRGKGDT